jgi:hypothetical protein
MNKSKSKKRTKKVQGVAAAYVSVGGSSARRDREDRGMDIIVSSVLGNANFTCLGYSVNPGLEDTFESLSKEAERYDCYEFTELAFHFVGTTVITTTVGQIGMAFEPNPNSGVPQTQAKFSAYECHISSSVYKPDGLWLHVPKAMLAGRRYVRRGIEGSNLTLYDPGSLIVMVRDEAGATTIGYIEVHYKVRFSNFHLEPNATPYRRNVLRVGRAADLGVVTATPTIWDLDTVFEGGLVHSLSTGAITLDPGFYVIIANMVCSDTAVETFSGLLDISLSGTSKGFGYFSSAGVANNNSTMACTCLVPIDTSSNVVPYVTLTGAAGTLKVEYISSITVLAL